MSALGFYDPTSLVIDGNQAAIAFIDAFEGSVTQVDITEPETARRVARSLRSQPENRISFLGGEMRELRGSLVFNPGSLDEGQILADNQRESIPVKLGFDVDADALPRNSYAMALGADHDGAFIVAKLATKAIIPAAEPRAQSGIHHSN